VAAIAGKELYFPVSYLSYINRHTLAGAVIAAPLLFWAYSYVRPTPVPELHRISAAEFIPDNLSPKSERRFRAVMREFRERCVDVRERIAGQDRAKALGIAWKWKDVSHLAGPCGLRNNEPVFWPAPTVEVAIAKTEKVRILAVKEEGGEWVEPGALAQKRIIVAEPAASLAQVKMTPAPKVVREDRVVYYQAEIIRARQDDRLFALLDQYRLETDDGVRQEIVAGVKKTAAVMIREGDAIGLFRLNTGLVLGNLKRPVRGRTFLGDGWTENTVPKLIAEHLTSPAAQRELLAGFKELRDMFGEVHAEAVDAEDWRAPLYGARLATAERFIKAVRDVKLLHTASMVPYSASAVVSKRLPVKRNRPQEAHP
jgi:hypothetical protein